MKEIKSLKVVFDREKCQVSFDGILLEKDKNYVNGKENTYQYKEVYNTPFSYSIWGSGIIELKSQEHVCTYDFNSVQTVQN